MTSRTIDVTALMDLPDTPGKDDEIGPHGPEGERCDHTLTNHREQNGVPIADCEHCEGTIYGEVDA